MLCIKLKEYAYILSTAQILAFIGLFSTKSFKIDTQVGYYAQATTAQYLCFTIWVK